MRRPRFDRRGRFEKKMKKIPQKQRKMNPKSLANLTAPGFEKGKSANPGGLKKGTQSVARRIKEILSEPDAKKLAKNIIELALQRPKLHTITTTKGDYTTEREEYDAVEAKLFMWANDTLLDRVDGKVNQPISNPDGTPVKILVEYVNKNANGNPN